MIYLLVWLLGGLSTLVYFLVKVNSTEIMRSNFKDTVTDLSKEYKVSVEVIDSLMYGIIALTWPALIVVSVLRASKSGK